MTHLFEPSLSREKTTGRRILPGVMFTPAMQGAAKIVLLYVVLAALWILWSDKLLFARVPDPAVVARLGVMKDWFFVIVTATGLFWLLRQKLEAANRQEEKLQLFVEHAPAALAMLDRDFRYVTASQRWNADYGLGDRDLRGQLHYDVFPKVPERWREVNRRALAGETLAEKGEHYVRVDGSAGWLRWEVRPWFDTAGAIGGIVLFTEDVTVRKQSEDALANAQSRLRLALECGHVGTWSWDIGTGKIDCDEALARLMSRTPEELAHGGIVFFKSCLHPDDLPAAELAVATALERGAEFVADYRIVRPDGRVLWVADRASVQRDASGQAVRMIGACADVSEVKRIEHALRDSEIRFREVVETIREVFWISDVPKNIILYVSPGYEAIWGRPCAELYVSGRAWLESVHDDDRERVWQAALTKQAAGTYDETYRIIRPDGSLRWIRDRAYPVRDERGEVVRIVGTAEDITERNKLEEQFLRAQRLEAIGTLASGVAHDLNNILAPMFMVGPLLRPKLTDASDGELLDIIEASAQRGANVVRQLLTFSRGIEGERGPLQVRHLVKEMVAIMKETFPREIGISQHIPAELPPVVGDATQLHQVLMNLCVNARDAMPQGGRLRIEAIDVVLDEPAVRAHAGAVPGRYVALRVTDTGEGIPADIRARIFEPFFTTKELGKGTGLGLSTVLGIVKSHGGFVTLESEVGRGSSFRVHLPAAELHAPLVAAPAAVSAPQGRGELVLVVDDEAAVRITTQHVLEKQGYRVLMAENGRDGLRVFLLHREHIAAVVTDLMMPEMGGLALVQALRDLSPGLTIIAATGLDGADKRDFLGGLGVTEILPKPYAPVELLAALERELKRDRDTATGTKPA